MQCIFIFSQLPFALFYRSNCFHAFSFLRVLLTWRKFVRTTAAMCKQRKQYSMLNWTNLRQIRLLIITTTMKLNTVIFPLDGELIKRKYTFNETEKQQTKMKRNENAKWKTTRDGLFRFDYLNFSELQMKLLWSVVLKFTLILFGRRQRRHRHSCQCFFSLCVAEWMSTFPFTREKKRNEVIQVCGECSIWFCGRICFNTT